MPLIVQIHKHGQLTDDAMAGLTFGYRPLIGDQAIIIYQGFYSLCPLDQPIEEADLAGLFQLTMGQWKKGRKLLEQFGLLRVFEIQENPSKKDGSKPEGEKQESKNKEASNDLLAAWQAATQETENHKAEKKMSLLLVQPLSLAQLMKHEIYGRFLLQAIGKEKKEQLQNLLFHPLWPDHARETTAVLDAVDVEKRWDSSMEEEFQLSKLYLHEPDRYLFDWKLFLKGAERIFPKRLRTRENLSRIAYLANAYGIGEVDMRHRVHRYIMGNKTWIDFDGLADSLAYSHKIVQRDPSDYTQPPMAFLQARSPEGVGLLPDEKQALIEIQDQTHFSNDVINTIVEYSLEACHGDFNVKYVRKVAQNARRNKVETRDQMIEYFSKRDQAIKQRTHGPSASIPEWYSETSGEQASQGDVEDALKLLDEVMSESDVNKHGEN